MASVRNEYQKGPALGFHSWPCVAAKQRDEKVCLLTLRGAVGGGAHLVSGVRGSACVCPGVAPGGARFAGDVHSVGEA